MGPLTGQKRKHPTHRDQKSQRPRKTKRTAEYHSSSSEDDTGIADADELHVEEVSDDESEVSIQLPNLEDEDFGQASASEDENAGSDSQNQPDDSASVTSSNDTNEIASNSATSKRKRNDPTRLATSISSILGSKLTTGQRSDPVLSRSVAASKVSKEVSESHLEAKVRRKLREEKKKALERSRVKDVLGLDDSTVSSAKVAEEEKRLKKTAQRGVIKLFNAVRAAQAKGEQAAKDASSLTAAGTATELVGMDRRKERVNEMSKKGFLDLLAGGAQ